jgi:hypothetical protein
MIVGAQGGVFSVEGHWSIVATAEMHLDVRLHLALTIRGRGRLSSLCACESLLDVPVSVSFLSATSAHSAAISDASPPPFANRFSAREHLWG